MRSAVPGTSSTVSSSGLPRSSNTKDALSASVPVRTLGPGRSCKMPVWTPNSWLISRAWRMTVACSSGLPCEKFRRKTLAPAIMSERMISGLLEAGPTVATILVRF